MAALLALAASGALAGTAQAVPTGAVQYAFRTPYVYPDGPFAPGIALGRVAMTATYDGCADGPEPCSWSAVSWAARFSCFADLDTDAYPWAVWSSAQQAANGTVVSGEQRFAMGTPSELELQVMCLYIVRERQENEPEVRLVGVAGFAPEPGTPPPAGTPPAAPGTAPSGTPGATPAPQSGLAPPVGPSGGAPTVQPVLTNLRARRAARSRLARRYGSWRRGGRKRVSCRRVTPTRYACTATWRYKGERRRARLGVVLRDGVIVARLR